MEIKVNEKVNFSELIKYIYDNNISDGTFIPDNCLDMSKHVHVNSNFFLIKLPSHSILCINLMRHATNVGQIPMSTRRGQGLVFPKLTAFCSSALRKARPQWVTTSASC